MSTNAACQLDKDARFLDALWLEVPPGEVVLQYADESFVRVCAVLRAGRVWSEDEDDEEGGLRVRW